MPRFSSFDDFAEQYGGQCSIDEATQGTSGLGWLEEIWNGLISINQSYFGDKNSRGDSYRAQAGIFNSFEINGAADQGKYELYFGVTIGTILRLAYAQKILQVDRADKLGGPCMKHLLSGHADETPPDELPDSILETVTSSSLAKVKDQAFFSIGFVFQHEAFHTLVGHAGYVRDQLNLGMDEVAFHRDATKRDELIQAMELEADGAAFTNFWLTLNQSPRFGYCEDPDPDPTSRIAEATMGCMIPILAIEARRGRLSKRTERRHPFPSRRVSLILRLLQTYERKGKLPSGTAAKLRELAAIARPKLVGIGVDGLLDLLAGDNSIDTDDKAKLNHLIKTYNDHLSVFEELSFAPRIRIT
ncbi:MAG: hypothetical protein AAGG48_26920 [Planctomycetota bacterium]